MKNSSSPRRRQQSIVRLVSVGRGSQEALNLALGLPLRKPTSTSPHSREVSGDGFLRTIATNGEFTRKLVSEVVLKAQSTSSLSTRNVCRMQHGQNGQESELDSKWR